MAKNKSSQLPIVETSKNLTQMEVKSLSLKYNLADAHTHQNLSHSQRSIIADLPNIFLESQERKQDELENRFATTFLNLNGQTVGAQLGGNLLCYSSSIAMEIVGKFISHRGFMVSLIEPTFDNIPDIFRSFQIPVISYSDNLILDGNFDRIFSGKIADAIFITLPNNPTGTYLDNTRFSMLAEFCAQSGKILIVDVSFRIFEPGCLFDQYEILENSGTDYILIEDTGKIWPTLDMKVGFLKCSRNLYSELELLHSHILLNVSPFTLNLLSYFIEDSRRDNLYSIRHLLETNRNYLRSKLDSRIFRIACPSSKVSVEFLRLVRRVSSDKLVSYLSSRNIGILSGSKFFWDHPRQGNRYIRVALARTPNAFSDSVNALLDACSEYYQ